MRLSACSHFVSLASLIFLFLFLFDRSIDAAAVIESGKSSDISFNDFEYEFFPYEFSFEVDGPQQLVYRIDSRSHVEKSSLQSDCLARGFGTGQCVALWNALRDTMFNPEGVKMGGSPDLSYLLTEEATISEHANFVSSCLDDHECLLANPNEYSLARSVFSSFSSVDIIAMRRVAFLHSVNLGGGTKAILESMLKSMSVGGLLADLDRVFVINYGISLPRSLTSLYPTVVFVQGSKDTARFEIPTLQVVHYFSRLSLALRGGSTSGSDRYKVLYLHTKGVSARSEVVSVRDWRNYMSHFVVDKFRKCSALLDTGLYDALGVNLITTYSYPWQAADEKNWHFSGNFWWADAEYIASLPTLSVHRNMKYDGEFWVCSGRTARLLSLHNSGTNHYTTPFPRSLYAQVADEL